VFWLTGVRPRALVLTPLPGSAPVHGLADGRRPSSLTHTNTRVACPVPDDTGRWRPSFEETTCAPTAADFGGRQPAGSPCLAPRASHFRGASNLFSLPRGRSSSCPRAGCGTRTRPVRTKQRSLATKPNVSFSPTWRRVAIALRAAERRLGFRPLGYSENRAQGAREPPYSAQAQRRVRNEDTPNPAERESRSPASTSRPSTTRRPPHRVPSPQQWRCSGAGPTARRSSSAASATRARERVGRTPLSDRGGGGRLVWPAQPLNALLPSPPPRTDGEQQAAPGPGGWGAPNQECPGPHWPAGWRPPPPPAAVSKRPRPKPASARQATIDGSRPNQPRPPASAHCPRSESPTRPARFPYTARLFGRRAVIRNAGRLNRALSAGPSAAATSSANPVGGGSLGATTPFLPSSAKFCGEHQLPTSPTPSQQLQPFSRAGRPGPTEARSTLRVQPLPPCPQLPEGSQKK